MGLRFACARLGAISVIALAACTTTLSYTYDAGSGATSSGTSGTSGSPGDAGGGDSAVLVTCAGGVVAQFCDDFDGSEAFPGLRWTVIDRTSNAFAAAVLQVDGGNRALELTAKSGGNGGFAFPSRKFVRSGDDKKVRVQLRMSLVEAARVTLVELGDQDGPNRVRIGVDGEKLFVDDGFVGLNLPRPVGETQALAFVVRASSATATEVKFETVAAASVVPVALPDLLEVRIAVTPLAGDGPLTKGNIAYFDDIVIQ